MNLEAEVVTRVLSDAGVRPERWAQVVDLIDDVSATSKDRILDALAEVDRSTWSEDEPELVAERIRTVLAHHRGFPDAWWVLSAEVLDRLASLYPRFASQDIVLSVRWLFSQGAQVPEEPGVTWEERDSAVARARTEAVQKVHSAGGLGMILQLARAAEARWLVGVALADAGLADPPVPLVLDLHEHGGDVGREVARAALLRGADNHGEEWIWAAWGESEGKELPDDWRVLFLLAAPFEVATWNTVRACAEDLQRLYWGQLVLYGRGELDTQRVRAVAEALHEFGHVARALDFLALYRRQAEPDQVLSVLEAAASPAHVGELAWQHLGHQLQTLLELVQEAEIEADRVAVLEWQLAPFEPPGGFQPRALFQRLARDPAFFVEILSYVYRRRHEEPRMDLSEQERARAMRAYDLLRSWHRLPGTQPDGSIQMDALRAWVRRARELAGAEDRIEICDTQVGQLLASSPDGTDGAWPNEAVREVIEEVPTEEIERGFITGTFNTRGVFSRGIGEGGDQERVLARKYAENADKFVVQWPRMADVLRRLANQYEADARRADTEARMEPS